MHGIQGNDPFDQGELVLDEYLKIEVAQQIKIHLVVVVPNGHNEGALFV
jgi:hypothetical protein